MIMTVELTDRIEMADSGEPSLDELFEMLERMPVPEGFKAEIVEGGIFMSTQRGTHWDIIENLLLQLKDRFGRRSKTKSDVRFDFPGYHNGFAPDLVKLVDTAQVDDEGRWRCEDVEFVAEVISRATAHNDYGPKKQAYALAGVPVYLIADPYAGKCHAYGHPEGDRYESELTVKFGEEIDLAPLGLDLKIATEDFPRD
jgi:Uma2 family endonuclease